jgi:hypothetical protein
VRAPSPSFRSEVAACRKRATGNTARNKRERRLMLEMLERWENHGATDQMWEDMTAASLADGALPLLPAEFIHWVLVTRVQCYERLRECIAEAPAIYSKIRKGADQDYKRGDVLRAAGKHIAVDRHAAAVDSVLGRKKKEAPRQWFMLLCRDAFLLNCGRPLDHVVAALTDIAFGGEEETTPDAVRRAAERQGGE